MKEIRYNDRIWFGKYKNKRISEILKIDPKFVQGLVKEDKICLDDRVMEHLSEKSRSRYSTFGGRPLDTGYGEPIIVETQGGLRQTRIDRELFYQPQPVEENIGEVEQQNI